MRGHQLVCVVQVGPHQGHDQGVVILTLLDQNLIDKAAGSPEASVFYLKMKADYYRYLAEFANGAQKTEHAGNAEAAYQKATTKATEPDSARKRRVGKSCPGAAWW